MFHVSSFPGVRCRPYYSAIRQPVDYPTHMLPVKRPRFTRRWHSKLSMMTSCATCHQKIRGSSGRSRKRGGGSRESSQCVETYGRECFDPIKAHSVNGQVLEALPPIHPFLNPILLPAESSQEQARNLPYRRQHDGEGHWALPTSEQVKQWQDERDESEEEILAFDGGDLGRMKDKIRGKHEATRFHVLKNGCSCHSPTSCFALYTSRVHHPRPHRSHRSTALSSPSS